MESLEKIEQEEVEYIEELPDDAHVFHMWTPLEFEADSEYSFVPKSKIFLLISNLTYLIVYPILVTLNKVMFGFKIEGKAKLKKIKGAKITVSNHIHQMDCTMNAIANAPHKTYFPTLQSNFQIPIVRDLIKVLNAIPIPNKVNAKKQFIKAMNELLGEGKTVHFYPEAALRPYCKKLRNFKKGAFQFAVENDIPIVPFVYYFEEPKGIYKYYKKKPCIKMKILEPVYPNKENRKQDEIIRLKEEVYNKMNEVLNSMKA